MIEFGAGLAVGILASFVWWEVVRLVHTLVRRPPVASSRKPKADRAHEARVMKRFGRL